MLPSTFYIMWPIQLQSLKLLSLMVLEDIHSKEITLFDLGGQGHKKPLHHVTYSATKFEVAMWRYIYKKRDGPTLEQN